MSKLQLLLETLGTSALLFGLASVAMHWAELPAIIAVHFGITGQPDGMGPKEVLAFLATISVFMYITFSIATRNPQKANVPWPITDENRQEIMHLVKCLLVAVKTEICLMFGYLFYVMVQCGLGRMSGLHWSFAPIFITVVFASIGVFYYAGRRFRKSAQ